MWIESIGSDTGGAGCAAAVSGSFNGGRDLQPAPPLSLGRRGKLAPLTYFPDCDAYQAQDPSDYRLDLRQSPAFRRRGLPGCEGGNPKIPRRADSPERPGRVIHVRHQEAASWFTPRGVHAKLKLLDAKGLPDFAGWRFITLSFDQKAFNHCPLTAFLVGRDYIRRFLQKCRDAGLWGSESRWAWKLEFQANGWPHWHLLVDRKRKFSFEEMRAISDAWGFGRTNCRRISKGGKFGYLFKYVFKGVYQEDGDGTLAVPAWFLDYFKPSLNGEKPESFSRVRFWQASKGFYTGQPSHYAAKDPVSCLCPWCVRQRLEWRNRSYVVVARDAVGGYVKSSLLLLDVEYPELIRRHLWDVDNGVALVLGPSSFVMAPDTLNRIVNKTKSCQLQQLLQQNRLSLARADLLRHQRRDLRTF